MNVFSKVDFFHVLSCFIQVILFMFCQWVVQMRIVFVYELCVCGLECSCSHLRKPFHKEALTKAELGFIELLGVTISKLCQRILMMTLSSFF